MPSLNSESRYSPRHLDAANASAAAAANLHAVSSDLCPSVVFAKAAESLREANKRRPGDANGLRRSPPLVVHLCYTLLHSSLACMDRPAPLR